MTLETLSSSEPPTCLVYETISATPLHRNEPFSGPAFVFGNAADLPGPAPFLGCIAADAVPCGGGAGAAGQARRKRRKRQRSSKNKEEAESQRMTHIAVERNRRRLMNDHLNVLRSLMPESYIQRGDQASIVGGAIDFVKELEQLLQSLEVQKRTLQRHRQVKAEDAVGSGIDSTTNETTADGCNSNNYSNFQPPFAQFFAFPQYIWCHAPRDYPLPPAQNRSAVADIEVTLTETHANMRILTTRRPRQLLGMVAGLQTLRLPVLHLNVTTLDSMVLYSLSIKVEEGCKLTTVDDIAAAVQHLLTLIEADFSGLTQ